MRKRKNLSLFLSDVGYGHIVRQSAVHFELGKLLPLNTKLYTHRNLDAAKRFFISKDEIEYIDLFNNINWIKQEGGSPDPEGNRLFLSKYEETSKEYIEKQKGILEGQDFVISDFVYEAFQLATQKKIPSFGVCHFTWDWFFSKIYPSVTNRSLDQYFFTLANQATKIFFPPFTPKEILDNYKNSYEVPFILRPSNEKVTIDNDRFKILIIDSGSGLLSHVVTNFLNSLNGIDLPYDIYVTDNFMVEHPNIKFVPKDKLLVNYIGTMDLVIGRAGFNTISECIGLRTPMVLLGEAKNPEITENILHVNNNRLGSFISIQDFETNFVNYMDEYLQYEYERVKSNMENHQYATNGAEVIAKEIANSI